MTTPAEEMTISPEEKLRPSPPERYEELSREHLEKAAAALSNDDALQASEEIWNAVASALKAVCQPRGWNHRYHNHLRAAAFYLADEWNRLDFYTSFRAFDDLHTNNYEHQEFIYDVLPMLDMARDFCQDLARMRLAPLPSQEHLTPQQRQGQERRWRTLTRPLSDRAAFGEVFSEAEVADLPSVKPPHTSHT